MDTAKWPTAIESRALIVVDWILPDGRIHCVGFFAPDDVETCSHVEQHVRQLEGGVGAARITPCLFTLPTKPWTC